MGRWAAACDTCGERDGHAITDALRAKKVLGLLHLAFSTGDVAWQYTYIERAGYQLRAWRKGLPIRSGRVEAHTALQRDERLWEALGYLAQIGTARWYMNPDSDAIPYLLRCAEAELRQWWYENKESPVDHPAHHLPPEVAVPLAGVLKEAGFDQWGRTPMDKLGGRTPYQALEGGDSVAVVELVRNYSDPSFT